MSDSRTARAAGASRLPTPSQTIMLGAVPIQRAPSSLARRLQQICAAAMAQRLTEEGLTPLQYAAFPFMRDEPGLDQIGLALRIGVDRTNVGLLIDHLEA